MGKFIRSHHVTKVCDKYLLRLHLSPFLLDGSLKQLQAFSALITSEYKA